MIISHKHRFIFLKTRKTAGTSIEIALSRFCGPDDVISTIRGTDEKIRRELGYRAPQNYKIPFHVYNPMDFRNLIRFRKRKRLTHSNAATARQFVGEDVWNSYFKFCFERNPFDKAISRYYWRTSPPRPTIGDYLDSIQDWYISDWNIYTIKNEISVDYIGHYESLQENLAHVAGHLGLPAPIDLPSAKGGIRKNREHYSRVLDQQARNRVESVCFREIEKFGYAWKEPRRAPGK